MKFIMKPHVMFQTLIEKIFFRGVTSDWFRYARLQKRTLTAVIAVLAAVIALGVVLSTLFVRQHYIADEIAGIALAFGAGQLCVNGIWGKAESGVGTVKA
jgi:membrane-associated phospholipid phosphatase